MRNNFYKIIHKYIFLLILLIIVVSCLTINPITTTQVHPKQKHLAIPSPTQKLQVKKPTVLAAAIKLSTITTIIPTVQVTPTITPQNTPIQPVQTLIPTIIVTPTTTTTIPTPTPNTQTVTLQIQLPNNTITDTLPLKTNANACDILQEAKDENKISSLTFDDSYLSMMHSRYVKEINGFQNNWTFTVNGISPLGCSLSNPKSNDTVIWKFN